MHLARALRAARLDAGASQEAVACHVRQHHTSISEIERGIRCPNDERLVSIERFLGCRAGSLVEAAQRDRRGLFFPATYDERDGVLVEMFMRWRDLPSAKTAELRRCFRSMLSAG